MTSAILFACNNQNNDKDVTRNDDRMEDSRKDAPGNERPDNDDRKQDVEDEIKERGRGGGNWTREEETAFLRDCEMESKDEVIEGKLIAFCSCMLNKAKYTFTSYKELESSNGESDMEIFGDCLRTYGNFNN